MIESSRNGAHQLALRRKSVKVFEGAMKVLTMRAPSDRGAASGAGTGACMGAGMGAGMGGSGAAAIFLASWRLREDSSREAAAKQARALQTAQRPPNENFLSLTSF